MGLFLRKPKWGQGHRNLMHILYVTYIICVLYKHSVFDKTGRTLRREGNFKPALCMGRSSYLIPASSREPRTSSFIVTSQLDGKGINT